MLTFTTQKMKLTLIKLKSKKLFLVGMLTAFSCISPVKIPEDVLPKAKMVLILTEIHISESKVSQLALRSQDSMAVLQRRFEQDIFRQFQTDSVTYNRSFRFYLNNPTYLEEIYTAIVDTLTAREKKISGPVPAPKPSVQHADSLKNQIRKKLNAI